MKSLSRISIGQFDRWVIVLWGLSLIILFVVLKQRFKIGNLKLLSDLNCFNEKGPSVIETENYIELGNINVNGLERSYWKDKFEILESIFNRKFIDVKIVSAPKIKVCLFFYELPSILPFEKIPKLAKMHIWLGVNQYGDDVVVNLQKSPAIYVDGKPGSGKTIAIQSILESWLRSTSRDAEVLIVTTKPADYFHYRNKSGYNISVIDPFDGDFEEKIDEILLHFKGIKELEQSFKKETEKLEKIDLLNFNLESLREQGICATYKRKFFIFDEAKDYLAKEKSDSKELSIKKQELVSVVHTHIRRTARFLSMPIIVASQTQNESDLDIPIKAFHLRLASNTNEAMSRIIAGDKTLTDLSFNSGKFFLKTEKEEHILKVPIIF